MHVLHVRIDFECSTILRIEYSMLYLRQRREKREIQYAQTILGGFEVASGVAQCCMWDELF